MGKGALPPYMTPIRIYLSVLSARIHDRESCHPVCCCGCTNGQDLIARYIEHFLDKETLCTCVCIYIYMYLSIFLRKIPRPITPRRSTVKSVILQRTT